ncbi:MAG: exodeoxyribonuclease IX [Lysobacterales bacterium CG17_big_fil_post_rev_8_21_14_2_50_64_11]|nr:MAG: exodeoxyribonuclease IX [Xanthomonadales bacterium CG17_big_fil_post_rev_8_21_14_2_50_64_11]PIX60443.1 MAG: exodeoxyribonuclease IX [Xanthomonadales bacterium CG_4_10_14_3_um_filter_64_11]
MDTVSRIAPSAWLIDASIYVFRAWHSLPDEFSDADGHPVNAVHGFARFLLELLEHQRPKHIAVAFDVALEHSFRNAIYPAYKANRDPAPESLKRQFEQCMALTRGLGLTTLADPRYEADDLIGSSVHRLREHGLRSIIISADKDLSQLLDSADEQWDYARNQRWGHAEVKVRYGVHPHQMADFLGLAGDAADNIPGVPGIGSKTAAALLAHFDNLDALLQRVEEVPFLRLRGAAQMAQRLRDHGAQALLSRRLATIACDAPLPDDFALAQRRAHTAELADLLDQLRFGPMTRRRINALGG